MGNKKGRGGPQAVGPQKTKTRKRILTWYFTDVPGHKVVHRMYIETEVMEHVQTPRPQVRRVRQVHQAGEQALGQVPSAAEKTLALFPETEKSRDDETAAEAAAWEAFLKGEGI